MSPSNIECSGRMARAMPSWATAATLLAWALVRVASVSTTPIVVAAGRARFSVGRRQRLSLAIIGRCQELPAVGPQPASRRVDG